MMLQIARYRLSFRVVEPLSLPDYAGSTLRGAFGHALMQLSGISKEDAAQKNPMFLQSPYAKIFDPQAQETESSSLKGVRDTPVPYIIEAPLTRAHTYQPGETLSFHLVLTGSALSHLAIIILAWRRALLRGIGHGDGKAELLLVEQEQGPEAWQEVYRQDNPTIRDHNTTFQIPAYNEPQNVHLILETPLRLQNRGKIIGPREISANIFLRHLIRRITLMLQQHNQSQWSLDDIHYLNTLADTVQDERRLRWQEWTRYSSRQRQSMTLGGMVGRWYLQEVPAELLPFIYLGQWLHLGKEVAFGLGKYQWIDSAWAPPAHPPLSQACEINPSHKSLA